MARGNLPVAGSTPIPARAGIGLRSGHYGAVLETWPAVGWLEVHPENFFAAGGRTLAILEQVRSHYPLSLHGVGLSLGSTDPLNRTHLDKLKALIARFEPALVSEHLSWGSAGGIYLNDLLPLPYTEEALQHMVGRVLEVQDALGRQILIENVSSYLTFTNSDLPEWEFLAQLAAHSGCGILLDINNIHVNAHNHGFDPLSYLDHIPAEPVQEFHLAGFTTRAVDHGELLIDTHNRPVCAAVWRLYAAAVERFGPRPTLIEWDQDLPPLATLLAEAAQADALLEDRHAVAV